MKFFIDTANLEQIKEAQALGILDGVTTNPSLMAKEGITGEENIKNHYKAICEIVDGDVSAEVIATDFEGMVREGEALADLHPQIVVKIPVIADGIKACKHFSDNGIKTNVTLIFSSGQALLAAKAYANQPQFWRDFKTIFITSLVKAGSARNAPRMICAYSCGYLAIAIFKTASICSG